MDYRRGHFRKRRCYWLAESFLKNPSSSSFFRKLTLTKSAGFLPFSVGAAAFRPFDE
jgi:hypothetical protein